MNRISIGSVLSGAAMLATVVAGASVVGKDGRRAPGADDAELLRASGLVVCSRIVDDRRRRSAGTGTVVGSRNTVVTAAHVFTDGGRRGPPVEFDAAADCVFRQYDVHGDITAEVAFSHAAMGAFRDNAGAPNQDWAVLRTAEPLPESTAALDFAFNGNEIENLNGLPMRIVAYHADMETARRSLMLSEGELFSVEYGGFLRLAHTADTGRMSSGAAIVHRTEDGQNVVVGINRSSANFGDFNLAVPLSSELEQALRSYAYGQVPLRRQRLAARDLHPARHYILRVSAHDSMEQDDERSPFDQT
ncbi:MAG TPA: serine protease [Gammaproteobacteria bacterium]|nr:serine protease [Gammaproteobacteria bacterium]